MRELADIKTKGANCCNNSFPLFFNTSGNQPGVYEVVRHAAFFFPDTSHGHFSSLIEVPTGMVCMSVARLLFL